MSNDGDGSIRERTFQALFGRATRQAQLCDTVLLVLILCSVAVVIVDSALDSASVWSHGLRSAEIGFTLLFTIEYLARLWCHPHPGQYARSAYGIIDFISIIPTYLAILVPGWETLAVLRVLRVLRILRIFELGRFSRAAELIGTALSAARYKIGIFATIVALVVMIAAAFMYMLEGPENGFTSIPTAAYWAVATLTTIGHPDLTPATPMGQVLASLVMILGYGFIAIPVGIITSEVVAAQNNLNEILAKEESEWLEFKSSAFFAYQNPNVPEKVIFEASVLKPVAGFLNGKGGTLAIGVNDDGVAIGVEKDLETKAWDIDKYVNSITNSIMSQLGAVAATMTNITVEKIDGRTVCLFEVQRSPDPVYVNTIKKPQTFFVRINNSTQELTGPDLVSYIRKRWN